MDLSAALLTVGAATAGAALLLPVIRFLRSRLTLREVEQAAERTEQILRLLNQFRDNITRVQELGSTAAPAIKDASARLIETMTQGDGTGFRMATTDMFAACTDAGFSNKGN